MATNTEKSKKTKMPTAAKRELQHTKKRAKNRSYKSRITSAVREINSLISQKSPTKEVLSQLSSLLDKGVKKGIIEKNRASRLKSRYALRTK